MNELDKKEVFSIGELAKVCNTTKATLYHYEKVGLLIPETNENNGYRYYKLNDYYVFMYIAHLTRIGFSLDEIKESVKHKTFSTYMSSVENSFIRLSEQQEQIRLRNERTQRGLRAIKRSYGQPLNQPHITYRELENYLCIPFSGNLNSKDCIECQAKHLEYSRKYNIDLQRHFLGFYTEQSELNSPPLFRYVLSKMNEKYLCEYLLTRPEGMYISMYYRGPFTQEGNQAYRIMADYMSNHNFNAQTGIFVEDIVGPFISSDPLEYVSLMYIKIE